MTTISRPKATPRRACAVRWRLRCDRRRGQLPRWRRGLRSVLAHSSAGRHPRAPFGPFDPARPERRSCLTASSTPAMHRCRLHASTSTLTGTFGALVAADKHVLYSRNGPALHRRVPEQRAQPVRRRSTWRCIPATLPDDGRGYTSSGVDGPIANNFPGFQTVRDLLGCLDVPLLGSADTHSRNGVNACRDVWVPSIPTADRWIDSGDRLHGRAWRGDPAVRPGRRRWLDAEQPRPLRSRRDRRGSPCSARRDSGRGPATRSSRRSTSSPQQHADEERVRARRQEPRLRGEVPDRGVLRRGHPRHPRQPRRGRRSVVLA